MQKRPSRKEEANYEISKIHSQTMKQIHSLLKSMSLLTDDLDSKLDGMLYNHQHEFVDSYRNHLAYIKQVVTQKDELIEKLQEKVRHYEHESALSTLISKVKKLEDETARLYKIIQQKDKIIHQDKITQKMFRMENRRLSEDVRRRVREKQYAKIEALHSPFLTTIDRKPQQQLSITQPHIDFKDHTYRFLTEMDNTKAQPEDCQLRFELSRLNRKYHSLNAKYQKLLRITTFNQYNRSELESFFFQCVQEVKKALASRKKRLLCQTTDLRSEDRIRVMMSLLNNQQIVRVIHQAIFDPKQQQQGVFSDASSPEVILKNKTSFQIKRLSRSMDGPVNQESSSQKRRYIK